MKIAADAEPTVIDAASGAAIAEAALQATAINATRRLRLAFIARRFGVRFGGAEAYGEHLLHQLQKYCDIHVFCQEWDSALTLPHTIVPRHNRLPRWANLALFTHKCQQLTHDFDVIHSHENSWLGDVQVVHVMPVRYARFHRPGKSPPWGRQLQVWTSPRWVAYLAMEAARLRARQGRLIVAASDLIADQIATAYKDTAPVAVITPGVRLPQHVVTRAEARRQLGLAPKARYALLVANDPVRKGLKTVLQAMSLVPDVHLLVVGGEGDTPQRVQSLVNAAQLGQRTTVLPGRSDLSNVYAAADFCVFPTLGDAFGMVPLEAMAYGLPVILSSAAYCGFARYVSTDLEALILPDPTDAQQLACTMTQLLQQPELYARLSNNGFALAQRFSWDEIAVRFVSHYRRLAVSVAPVQ